MTPHREVLQASCFRADIFHGQVVWVTGGGSGIGREIARRFAALGAHCIVSGRRPEPLRETVELIRAEGGRARECVLDIRDEQMAASVLEDIVQQEGRLDVLMNNAGGQYAQAAIDLSAKGWRAVIDTNLNGTWNCMQAVARHWRTTGHPGNIVNIVLDIWRGIPGMAHSVAARGGVVYLSKTVAVEWAPLDIRVNCVAPGLVTSSGFERYDEHTRRKLERDANPMRKAGTVEDVAEACVFLASPSARFITGEVLTVDGGQQLWGDVWGIPKPEHFHIADGGAEAP